MSVTRTYTTERATAWVCTDCHLATAGYSDHETGHDMPEPFSTDPSVVDVINGSDPLSCEACRQDFPDVDFSEWDGSLAEIVDAHTEHDHDSFSMAECEGCGDVLAGDRYAVTIEIQSELIAIVDAMTDGAAAEGAVAAVMADDDVSRFYDRHARTVAGWYASPNVADRALTSLSQGAPTDVAELRAEIERHAFHHPESADDMSALTAWLDVSAPRNAE